MSKSPRQQTLPGLEEEDPQVSSSEEAPQAKPAPKIPEKPPVPMTKLSPEQLRGQRVYVLDGHALVFQVFHALPEMTSPGGEAVGAVYGFVRDVLYLIETKKPDILLCAFDLPGKTFRHDLYPEYKANRGEMPEELVPQFPKIRRILDALGIPVLDYENFEADDILATVARLCTEQQMHCSLVTSDKDCRQLIGEYVNIYNVRKDIMYDADALREDWGIRPDQVVDFQALVGDSVDNIPGIALIGPKIARELLGQYDTLANVLDNAAEVKGAKRKQNLMEGREVALLCRDLVRLDDQVPIEVDWNAGRVGSFNHIEAKQLFTEFGFRSFGERLDRQEAGHAPPVWEENYQVVDTPEKLADLVDQMHQQSCVSLDTETTSVSPRWAEIVGYSFAWSPGEAYYVPVRGPEGDTILDGEETLDALRPVLTDASIEKIGQNLKYDMIVLRNYGLELAGASFDTMVASYLLDAGERNHNLNDLSKRYLNHTPIPISQLIGTGKNQKRMDEVSVATVGHYAAEDADIPLRLMPILGTRLQEMELDELFETVEIPLVEVLVELESNGICVDRDLLKKLSEQYGSRLKTLEGEIYELAGHELNIASPKQLAKVLFEELELPVIKKTKTGPSTDAEVLGQLAKQHPLPAKIIEFRQFAKLKNTYVDALPEMIHPETGRVHASFNQVVAATGRLSSSDPNLQNIPVRTDRGREIRAAFLPREGWKLLAADYSQIELRVLAHFSGDQTMSGAFERDEDIHARVASEVHGVELSEVTGDMRRTAKAVNFGVIYGQSPYGLAASLDIPQEEAGQFIDSYFDQYPGVEAFLEKTLENCRKNGYVKTILGRRRAIHGVRASAGRQRNLPERTAINTVVQGSAADLIKLAMIRIYRRLREEDNPAKMLLQIHDELIFEVPSEQLSYVGNLVAEEMASVMELAVPLKVDLKSGDSWADCEPW